MAKVPPSPTPTPEQQAEIKPEHVFSAESVARQRDARIAELEQRVRDLEAMVAFYKQYAPQ